MTGIDVSIKVGDVYVPLNFVVLDTEEDAYTKIILGRPFLVAVGCGMDVKRGVVHI